MIDSVSHTWYLPSYPYNLCICHYLISIPGQDSFLHWTIRLQTNTTQFFGWKASAIDWAMNRWVFRCEATKIDVDLSNRGEVERRNDDAAMNPMRSDEIGRWITKAKSRRTKRQWFWCEAINSDVENPRWNRGTKRWRGEEKTKEKTIVCCPSARQKWPCKITQLIFILSV